jgi:hypothetical protein
VRPIPPVHAADIDQPQIGFVKEGRRLETVVGSLTTHASSGDLPQLVVHTWNDLLEGGWITSAPS